MSTDDLEVTTDVSWRSDLPTSSGECRVASGELDEATRRELTALIARVEDVDWSAVPGVSPATARAFTAALEGALEVDR